MAELYGVKPNIKRALNEILKEIYYCL